MEQKLGVRIDGPADELLGQVIDGRPSWAYLQLSVSRNVKRPAPGAGRMS